MTVTNELWTHGPRSSIANYRHLTLTVTSAYKDGSGGIYETLWKWTVCGKDSTGVVATSGSMAIDRIGACAEAEENAQERVRAIMVKHGVLDDEGDDTGCVLCSAKEPTTPNQEDEGKKQCSVCNATDVPLRQEDHKWFCYHDLSCFDRAKANREDDENDA